ncbi:MAG: copper-binding protein [Ramlibacter sp.]
MKRLGLKHLYLLLALVLAYAGGAAAQSAAPARPAASAGTASLATGEVLEVDQKEQRVLVKHGPIASIGMDAMTMEFLVPDRKLLQKLKPGDQIRFAVVWRKGEYEITRAQVKARKPLKP